jgi:hypothetical protein
VNGCSENLYVELCDIFSNMSGFQPSKIAKNRQWHCFLWLLYLEWGYE